MSEWESEIDGAACLGQIAQHLKRIADALERAHPKKVDGYLTHIAKALCVCGHESVDHPMARNCQECPCGLYFEQGRKLKDPVPLR